jgi:ABC-type transporter Mla subunit MlaD
MEPTPPRPAPPAEPEPAFESPDVTTRYAVAQLQDLNDRVTGLTEDMTARTELALQQVATELRSLASQREVDLTEQAAGIFGAVQAGADALAAFSKTVGEVTDDLRAILDDALKAIGGTDGLAAWVAASASDIAETRQEFADSLAKIQRDMSLLRRRSNADSKPAKLDDEQVAFIIDAVTDSVLAGLDAKGRRR